MGGPLQMFIPRLNFQQYFVFLAGNLVLTPVVGASAGA